jgi:hypothetical protein
MNWHTLTFVLLIASLLAVAGCGDDASTSATGDSTAVNREPVSQALVSLEDFPDGATTVAGLPSEPCGPVAILEDHGGEAAESKMFAFGRVRVQEAVGRFATAKAADAAFKELSAKARRECIGAAIESFNSGENEYVKVLPVHALDVGDGGALVRYLIVRRGSGPVSYVDIVAVKSGARVLTLACIVERNTPSDAVVRRVGEVAVGQLAGASG